MNADLACLVDHVANLGSGLDLSGQGGALKQGTIHKEKAHHFRALSAHSRAHSMAPCMRMAEPACSTSYCLPHRPPPLPHCARQPSRSCSQHSATCIQRPQWQLPSRWSSCRSNFRTAAGIKIIESFDGKFELARDSEEALKQLLASPTFAKQVCHPILSPFSSTCHACLLTR